jgi:hypothetical protein
MVIDEKKKLGAVGHALRKVLNPRTCSASVTSYGWIRVFTRGWFAKQLFSVSQEHNIALTWQSTLAESQPIIEALEREMKVTFKVSLYDEDKTTVV